jgi:hypothetical protein
LVFTTSATAAAQNANSSPNVRPRVTVSPANANKATEPQKSTDVQQPTTAQPTARRTETKPKIATTETPGSESVVAAFNALINGIRHADVKAVTNVYLNSPRLILFNSNGTVTKGWEQLRKNRESSYPDLKDVKLDVRDLSITMLGRDGAVVSCLWTQSQTGGKRLEGNSPAHFTRQARSIARTSVRAGADCVTVAGSKPVAVTATF